MAWGGPLFERLLFVTSKQKDISTNISIFTHLSNQGRVRERWPDVLGSIKVAVPGDFVFGIETTSGPVGDPAALVAPSRAFPTHTAGLDIVWVVGTWRKDLHVTSKITQFQ